jgi:Fur family zinc uptake transcriptional regulator
MISPKESPLTPHCKKVLDVLVKQGKPMTAYELLEKLRRFGIKAPPTVYRALESLMERGLVHRIETLGAFVACHDEDELDTHADHKAQFAVCRSCHTVTELHDERLDASIHALAKHLKFNVERPMLELMGLCERCDTKAHGA